VPEPVYRAEGIVKRYAGRTVLGGVDVQLRPGEILGLLGDNGAGKSTLVKTFAGFVRPDAGRLFVDGRETELGSVGRARALGIECVYQDLALVEQLSVHHNMALGREPRLGRTPFLAERRSRLAAEEALERLLGIDVPDVTAPLGTLSGGQRQAIAIARAVGSSPRILLLDEPLAAMGVRESAYTVRAFERLRADGVATILVSHNHAHALGTCDRIVLLQDGVIVLDQPAAETTVDQLHSYAEAAFRSARAMLRG
jgi:simple sugar transport system ATP-binding protein